MRYRVRVRRVRFETLGARLWSWRCDGCDRQHTSFFDLPVAHEYATEHAKHCKALREKIRATSHPCTNCQDWTNPDTCPVCLGRGWAVASC